MDEIPSNGDLTRICSVINITEGPWALCSPAMGRGVGGGPCVHPGEEGGSKHCSDLATPSSWELSELGLRVLTPWFQSPPSLGLKWGVFNFLPSAVHHRLLCFVPRWLTWCPSARRPHPAVWVQVLTSPLCVCVCLWHNRRSACVVRLQGARAAQPLQNLVWREFPCVSCVVIRSDHATCRRGHAWATPPQAGTPLLLLSHLFLFLDFFPHFVETLLRSLSHWRCASSTFPRLLRLYVLLTLHFVDSGILRWNSFLLRIRNMFCLGKFLAPRMQKYGLGALPGGAPVCTLVFSFSSSFVFNWLFFLSCLYSLPFKFLPGRFSHFLFSLCWFCSDAS